MPRRARRKYTRPALHPSRLLISVPLRCSSQQSRLISVSSTSPRGATAPGATRHTGGDQPVVHRLAHNTELDRQSRDRLVVIDVRPHKRRHIRSANRSRHHPQLPTQAPRRPARRTVRAPPPSRTSPLALVRPQLPNGLGLTAATDLRLQLTPTTEISAVVPGQTWCQSEREVRRNPSRRALPPTLTVGADRCHRPGDDRAKGAVRRSVRRVASPTTNVRARHVIAGAGISRHAPLTGCNR
jgi:hypothetical protein